MAVGMKTMVKRKVIVRRLDALEALGGIDAICSDKTGTLTQGKMITRRVWLPGVGTYSVERYGAAADPTLGRVIFTIDEEAFPHHHNEKKHSQTTGTDTTETSPASSEEGLKTPPATTPLPRSVPDDVPAEAHTFLQSIALCNTATLQYDKEDQQWESDGDPTEIALQVFAQRFGDESGKRGLVAAGWKLISEHPFDSDIKRMTVLYEEPGTGRIHFFAKGAVERILNVCINYGQGHTAHPITEKDKELIHEHLSTLADEGLVSISHDCIDASC